MSVRDATKRDREMADHAANACPDHAFLGLDPVRARAQVDATGHQVAEGIDERDYSPDAHFAHALGLRVAATFMDGETGEDIFVLGTYRGVEARERDFVEVRE